MLAWCVPLAVYALSARRDVWFWDTGEMDTVPWILGIAHPTGFPAYVLIGYAFSHIVAIGSVAFRMSLMSACAMAGAAYFVFRTIARGGRVWIAMGCSWVFAFGGIVWTRGTRAEVHALAACAFAATIFYLLRWQRGGCRRDLFLAAFAWGVGFAVHPVLALALPGALFVIATRPGALAAADVARAAAIAVGSAVIWYVYLPLRSLYVSAHGLDPATRLGITGGPFWNYDRPATLHGFAALVSGGDFNLAGVLHAILFGASRGAGIALYSAEALHELLPVGVALAIVGIGAAWMNDRTRTAALLLFAVPPVVFGLGFPPESDPRRYFIYSFVVAAIFIGEGLCEIARREPRVRAIAAAAAVVIALALVATNRWVFAQATDESARAIVSQVQERTPTNAIVVANWLDAPPLAYAAYVERSLGRRIVAAAWVGDLGTHARAWLRSRPVFVVGASNVGGLAGYRLIALRNSQISRLAAR